MEFPMKFTVEHIQHLVEDLSTSDSTKIERNESFKITFFDVPSFLKFMKDEMDCPDSKLTHQKVAYDFGLFQNTSNSLIQKIMDYYNKRVDVFEKIKLDVEKDFEGNSVEYVYPITKDMFGFSCTENDPQFNSMELKECFYRVKVER